jgi:hypothetical protein
MVFGSLWCRKIKCLHLILDNGTTHAPKQIGPWIASLRLPFEVQLHWLPVHASWLDQVEIVFSILQRKVIKPNDFDDLQRLETQILDFLAHRNKDAKPIEWTYTAEKLSMKLCANL